MKAIHRKRLLMLARFLSRLSAKKFHIWSLVANYSDERYCGTVCCAAGWCPKVFPRSWKWVRRADGIVVLKYVAHPRRDWAPAVADFFGLSRTQVDDVFTSSGYPDPYASITPKMVAAKLRELAKGSN